MADVITRLRVESSEYDSKIKRASQGLLHMEQACRKVGGTLAAVEKDELEFVRSLGKMETVSKDARGQIGELTKAFTDLSLMYKRLTDEEKNSPYGRALTASLGELKARIQNTKKDIEDISKDIGSVSSPAGFSKLDGMLSVLGGNMLTKAAGAVANLGSAMYGMVQQGIELAKQGEGIRIAFERLGRGDILDGLREATHGTVTDIELMKAAVKFNDFKLPIEELGTMLAFAQQKAKDTGQSVDYMVDSIVTGLGRKSLMILDNLGLSASEIKDRMAETGDMTKAVGAIIRDQMAAAGDYVETAADRAAQANVSLQNKMEELGRKFAPLQEASNNFWTSMKIGILDVVGGPLARLLNGLTEAGRMMNAYGKMGGSAKVGRMVSNLANAKDSRSLYNRQENEFLRYISSRKQYINDIRAWQGGDRSNALATRVEAIAGKYGILDTGKIQAEIDAAEKMLAEYKQSAASILQPNNQNNNLLTGNSTWNSLTGNSMVKSGGSGKSPAAEATYELLEDVREEKPKVYDFMDATSNVTASMKDLQQQMKLYKDILANATTQSEYNIGSAGVSALQRQMKLQPIALEGGITIAEAEVEMLGESLKENLEAYFKDNPIEFKSDSIAQDGKNAAKTWKDAASAVQSVGSAFANIEDPATKAMGTVMQAIATIALGFAQAASAKDTTSSGWAWLAWLAAGTSAMATTIATVHSLTHYAKGGIVGGNDYTDNTLALVSSGEVILNKAQQENLAGQLNNGGGAVALSQLPYVTGEKIVLGVNNWAKQTGRGQLIFSKS